MAAQPFAFILQLALQQPIARISVYGGVVAAVLLNWHGGRKYGRVAQSYIFSHNRPLSYQRRHKKNAWRNKATARKNNSMAAAAIGSETGML